MRNVQKEREKKQKLKKKGESMATLSKQPQREVMVEMPTKMEASKKKINYSPSKKGRKRSIPLSMTMFKGIYKLMAAKAITFFKSK